MYVPVQISPDKVSVEKGSIFIRMNWQYDETEIL